MVSHIISKTLKARDNYRLRMQFATSFKYNKNKEKARDKRFFAKNHK
jgi:hypothetical protein